jgi:hypothetical protein
MKPEEEEWTSEDWEDLRKQQQAKRESNREHGAEALRKAGVPVQSKNLGAHLIVGDNHVDYWPGTGKWIVRKTKKQGRGIAALLKFLQSNKPRAP